MGLSGRVPVARQIRNLALIGFMGVGKTSVGHLLAERLRFDFLDTDVLIERRAGKSITDIFAQDGEPVFRELERLVVAQMVPLERTVISTGGGLPAHADNLTSLKAHALVVYLWASPEKLWERVRYAHHRPLLSDPDPQAKIRRLLTEREPFYRQADVMLNTERRSLAEVAQHVIGEFRTFAHGPPGA
jgi:shikimate kinase